MSEADTIIEEIRRSRSRMSEECGHNVDKYFEYLREFNERYNKQVKKYRELSRSPDQVHSLPE